jgi:hypothetical protein
MVDLVWSGNTGTRRSRLTDALRCGFNAELGADLIDLLILPLVIVTPVVMLASGSRPAVGGRASGERSRI